MQKRREKKRVLQKLDALDGCDIDALRFVPINTKFQNDNNSFYIRFHRTDD